VYIYLTNEVNPRGIG